MSGWSGADWGQWLDEGETLVRSAEGRLMSPFTIISLLLMAPVAVFFDLLPRFGGGWPDGAFVFTKFLAFFAAAAAAVDCVWHWRYAITDQRVLALSGLRLGEPSLTALPLGWITATTGVHGEVFLRQLAGQRKALRFMRFADSQAFAQEINRAQSLRAARAERS